MDIITYKTYLGSSVKETSVLAYESEEGKDTSWAVIFKNTFDLNGNRLSTVGYSNGIVSAQCFYSYGLDKKINLVTYKDRNDSIVFDDFKFNENQDIVFFRMNYLSGNNCDVKCKYDSKGRPEVIIYDWYFKVNVRFIAKNGFKEDLLNVQENSDNKRTWLYFNYYSDDKTEAKSGANLFVTRLFCKVDQRGNISKVESSKNGELIDKAINKFDSANRIIQRRYTSEIESKKPFNHIYKYAFY